MNIHTATVDFVDVAAAWRQMATGSFKVGRHSLGAREVVSSIHNPGFSNATVAQMGDWLDHGYSVPGSKIIGRNTRDRRKLRFNEDDGEIQIDRVFSGDDAIYLKRSPRQRQRGLKIEIELAVLAATPPSVLTAYADWIGKLVSGLEGGGFQTQIDVVSRARGVTKSKAREQLDVNIRVKKFGQRGSQRSWSALLSPGGFRHLVFTARVLGCEKSGAICASMGGSFGQSWGVEFDPKDRKLTIRCAASTQHFPAEQMDAELAAIKF